MKHLIIGLGNPGEEYANTRHSVGREILERFRMHNEFPSWEFDKKANALCSKSKIGRHEVELLLPETFMNKSGKSVLYAKNKNKIKFENIIVVHDDIDLPIGKLRISFARGSGGHKGVESIFKILNTKKIIRLRFGIVPLLSNGKLKKPKGEQKVTDFVLKKFTKNDREKVEKEIDRAVMALDVFVKEGLQSAMNKFN